MVLAPGAPLCAALHRAAAAVGGPRSRDRGRPDPRLQQLCRRGAALLPAPPRVAMSLALRFALGGALLLQVMEPGVSRRLITNVTRGYHEIGDT